MQVSKMFNKLNFDVFYVK